MAKKRTGLRSKSVAARNGDATNPTANGAATTKAARIRQVAQGMGKRIRPRDVIAALAEQGVEASSAQVSLVLKKMGKRRRRSGAKAAETASTTAAKTSTTATSPALSLASLMAAKKLADQLGGIEAAKTAVDALAKIS